MRRAARLATFASVLAFATPTLAQTTQDAERAAARTLGYEGSELYRAGDYAAALDKLDRAYRVLQVPSLGLWSGRCMEELGQLVAAAERYLETTRLELPDQGREVHEEAQRDAAALREQLLPRIPHLVIEVTGAEPGTLDVRIDDAPLSTALLGTRVPIDPGTHRIEVQRDDTVKQAEVEAVESDTARVTLTFDPEPEAPPPAPAPLPPPVAPPPAPPPLPPPVAPDTGSTMAIAGWVSVGIGGAGLVVGAVAGGVLLGKNGTLGDACVDDVCPASRQSDVDTFNTLRPVTTVGLVVGVAGLATGVTLLLLAPDDDPTEAWLSPWIAPTGAGLTGTF